MSDQANSALIDAPTAVLVEPPAPAPAGDGWRVDKQGRSFVSAKGRSGIVFRRGNETIEEALARDAKGPRDQKPKRTAVPKVAKAAAPTSKTARDIERELAEALSAPAVMAAMAGDEWLANHFTAQAPTLARNLVSAAEYNPWLKSKLEAAMLGDSNLMGSMALIGVAAAAAGYAIPPLVYLLNPPFIKPEAREMFGIPTRKKREEAQASGQGPTPPQAAPGPGVPAGA